MKRLAIAAVGLALVVGMLAAPGLTRAAFPGVNGKIVFQSHGNSITDISVMNADGSGVTNLTNSPEFDDEPAWSPNGSKIAFWSYETFDPYHINAEIFVMNADGSGRTRLTYYPYQPTFDHSPSWSPDGSKIAFTRAPDGSCLNLEIYVMNSDGSGQTRLTNNTTCDESPAWSPDGTKIAFGGDGQIRVMSPDGSGATQLTTAGGSKPSWSPDGSKIAFESFRDGNYEIYVMNANGTDQTRLTDGLPGDEDPAWSPDGSKIAFESTRLNNQADIYLMNPDGSGVERLTNNPDYDMSPDWQPRILVGGIAELPPLASAPGGSGMGGATYAVLAGAAAGVLAFAVLATLSIKRWRVK